MDTPNKLLEGGVNEVKAGIAGLSHDDLLKLKAAEQAGQNRKGVVAAIDSALSAAEVKRAGGMTSTAIGTASALDTSPAANLAPASGIDTSGAPQQIVPDVDMTHPAVDADPRANTTETQNRIDFNDPTVSGADAVKAMLAKNVG